MKTLKVWSVWNRESDDMAVLKSVFVQNILIAVVRFIPIFRPTV